MRLITSLSVQRPRFVPRASQVEFLIVKSSLEQVSLQACSFSPVVLHQCFTLIVHSSTTSVICTN